MEHIFPPEVIKNSVEQHFSTFSRKSQVIYLCLLLFTAGAFVPLFLVKTEITILSRGLIRSAVEPIPLTTAANAVILKSSVAENRPVNTGDTLLWLDKEKIEKRIAHLNSLIDQNNDYLEDLACLTDFGLRPVELRTALFKRSREEYRQKISEFDTEIGLLEKQYRRSKILFENQVIPQAEKEEKEYQLAKKTEEKEVFIKLTLSKWQSFATEYRSASQNYRSEIAGWAKDTENYYLLAPHSGYISNYNGVLPGNYVASGTVIGFIRPADSLLSEHLLPPKDIGYLQRGMKTFLQVDAYDYHEWGLATGSVTDISEDIYLINNQPFFKVRCHINEKYLELKNGYRGELKKGLTTTARFVVTERTLAQLLVDKTENWLNPNITDTP
jgi:membrane fusion protein, peptide pheromone/bacteriocin exporter